MQRPSKATLSKATLGGYERGSAGRDPRGRARITVGLQCKSHRAAPPHVGGDNPSHGAEPAATYRSRGSLVQSLLRSPTPLTLRTGPAAAVSLPIPHQTAQAGATAPHERETECFSALDRGGLRASTHVARP